MRRFTRHGSRKHPRVARLSAFAIVSIAALTPAAADDVDGELGDARDERQVALAADVGFSGGATATPGGLRVGGHYLYRLADRDWFDTTVAFTFGGRGDACMDTADAMPCDRAITDGFAGDLALGLRRDLAPRRGFTPYLRAAAFARALRFTDVGGFAAGGELGAGVRAPVGEQLALVAGAHAFLGARLTGDADRQLGMTVTVGAEIGMR